MVNRESKYSQKTKVGESKSPNLTSKYSQKSDLLMDVVSSKARDFLLNDSILTKVFRKAPILGTKKPLA